MNFTDRTSLGNAFARKLERFRGKDAIILCLQEHSLLTCLTMASQLRAYVYPLVYAPVYLTGDRHTLIGAFDQDGDFCPVLAEPADKDDEKTAAKKEAEIAAAVKEQHAAALESMRAQTSTYGMQLMKNKMDGRDVILAADILSDALPVLVAQQFMRGVSPKSLTAIAGNASPEAARILRLCAAQTDILDVVSGMFYADNKYFEYADSYTPKQKQSLTRHIAAYWQ